MDVRYSLQIGFERPELLVLQLHMKIVRQSAAEFGLDFRIRLSRRAAEKTVKHLLRRDRIAVTAENFRMRAA